MTAAGVCGTDIHLWNGRDQLPDRHVLGHDFCATVDALGEDVDASAVPIGARVTVNPSNFCGACGPCRRGTPNLCTHGTVMGMQDPGCFQEYVVVRADRLIQLPDEVSDVAASVLEPVAVALHVHDRVKGIVPSGIAVTVGAGPIGLVTGRLLCATGYRWVAVEPLEERRDVAVAWGAHATFAPDVDDEALVSMLGDAPAVVVACVAGPDIAPWTLRIAPAGSAIAVVGNSPSGYSSSVVMLRELSILGIRGGTRYDDAVRIAAARLVDLDSLVSHRRELDQAPQSFEELDAAPSSIVRMALSLVNGN